MRGIPDGHPIVDVKCYACDARATGARLDRALNRYRSACDRHSEPGVKSYQACAYCLGPTRRGSVEVGGDFHAHASCHAKDTLMSLYYNEREKKIRAGVEAKTKAARESIVAELEKRGHVITAKPERLADDFLLDGTPVSWRVNQEISSTGYGVPNGRIYVTVGPRYGGNCARFKEKKGALDVVAIADAIVAEAKSRRFRDSAAEEARRRRENAKVSVDLLAAELDIDPGLNLTATDEGLRVQVTGVGVTEYQARELLACAIRLGLVKKRPA